ncbi:hypothetical protein PybrP1_007459 [[Pythium] brassicae (nom. inval.)]|nr:hypothetical protein PybrP1_007459 [[Pythium] brassicae (nom. inval.)]
MDLLLQLADVYTLDTLYSPTQLPRDSLLRQALSVSAITLAGGAFLYLSGSRLLVRVHVRQVATRSPRFLKQQERKEIAYALGSIPGMTLLMLPWFLAEVRGYSMLYSHVSDFGWGYLVFSAVWFLVFTDMLIYWFHRWLHHPRVYAAVHKPHHKWIVPTPFASHAFHPLDGFIRGLPYHLFAMLFPIHRVLFLALFATVNYWTISIHDGLHVSKNAWLNGAAHHAMHHSDFNYNYGQYFTLWDRLDGSYREPQHEPEREKQE